MKYKVMIEIPNIVEVEASSPEKAEEIVRDNLINTKQIKPTDPIKIFAIQETNI